MSFTYNLSEYLQTKNIDLVNALAVDNPFSCLKSAVQFYEDDLPGYQYIIEAEFKLWQSKWKTVGSKFRPLNAI